MEGDAAPGKDGAVDASPDGEQPELGERRIPKHPTVKAGEGGEPG